MSVKLRSAALPEYCTNWAISAPITLILIWTSKFITHSLRLTYFVLITVNWNYLQATCYITWWDKNGSFDKLKNVNFPCNSQIRHEKMIIKCFRSILTVTNFKWSATSEYPFPRGKLVNWYKRALSCAEISEKQMNLIINGAKRKFDNQLILVWAVLANRNTWSVICLHNFWGVNECTLHRSVHGSMEFEKYGHYLNTVNLGIRYRNKWARKSCLYRRKSMHTFIRCNIMFLVFDNSCALVRKFR